MKNLLATWSLADESKLGARSFVSPPILGGLGGGAALAWRYDVSKDGQRFLMNTAAEQSASAPIIVVTDWTAELKK